jgi:hypothetical protein
MAYHTRIENDIIVIVTTASDSIQITFERSGEEILLLHCIHLLGALCNSNRLNKS